MEKANTLVEGLGLMEFRTTEGWVERGKNGTT